MPLSLSRCRRLCVLSFIHSFISSFVHLYDSFDLKHCIETLTLLISNKFLFAYAMLSLTHCYYEYLQLPCTGSWLAVHIYAERLTETEAAGRKEEEEEAEAMGRWK